MAASFISAAKVAHKGLAGGPNGGPNATVKPAEVREDMAKALLQPAWMTLGDQFHQWREQFLDYFLAQLQQSCSVTEALERDDVLGAGLQAGQFHDGQKPIVFQTPGRSPPYYSCTVGPAHAGHPGRAGGLV